MSNSGDYSRFFEDLKAKDKKIPEVRAEGDYSRFFNDDEHVSSKKEKKPFVKKEIEYSQPTEDEPLWKTFGRGLSYQAQALPSAETPIELSKGAIEKASFGAVKFDEPTSPEGSFARSIGKTVGTMGIAGVANKVLEPLGWAARIFGMGGTGGAISYLEQSNRGEEIDLKEIAKESLVLGGLQAVGEVTNAVLMTKQAIDYISKKTKIIKPDVTKFMARRAWNKLKEGLGIEPTEEAINAMTVSNPEMMKDIWKQSAEETKQALLLPIDEKLPTGGSETSKFFEDLKPEVKTPSESETIELPEKPKKSQVTETPEIKTPEIKPTEKPKVPMSAERAKEIFDKAKEGSYATLHDEEAKKYEHWYRVGYVKYPEDIQAIDEKGLDTFVSERKKIIKDFKETDFPETRDQGKIYHGTPTKLNELSSDHYSNQNIYGQGFYTTDSLGIAKGYALKSGALQDPHIFEVKEKGKVNLYDMEKPIENELKDKLEKISQYNELLEDALAEDPKTLRDIYDFMGKSNTVSEDIQDQFNEIRNALETQGYKGLTHTGGKITKKIPHKVKIYFDPEKDLTVVDTVKPTKVKPVKKPKKPVVAGRKETVTPKKKTQPSPLTAQKKPVMGSEQAAKRSDIINLFRKAFKDPIRVGKFKQHALGIHKLWAKVTRLLKHNDIETAAHEIGHNLHGILYAKSSINGHDMVRQVQNALRPYLKELDELAYYGAKNVLMEGFAEFTRMYVTNPEDVIKIAPKFYQKFEDDLDAQYPELKEALLEARKFYRRYLQGTPESRVEAQIAFHQDPTWFEKLSESLNITDKFDSIKTNLLDDIFPAKRLVAEAFGIPVSQVETLADERNLYLLLRNMKGSMGIADMFVREQTFGFHDKKKIGEGYLPILKALKDPLDYKEFNTYLAARRTIEKLQQGIETGIGYTDAVATANKLGPKWYDLSKQWDKFWDDILKYVQDSGLYSKEQIKAIKDKNLFYAPMNRVMEDWKGNKGYGKGVQSRKVMKRMYGSTRDIIPPVESGLQNIYSMVINAERNRAGTVLAELANMKDIGHMVERVPTPTGLKDKILKEDAIKQIEKHIYKTMGIPEDQIELSIDTPVYKMAVELADIIPDALMRFGATVYPAGENIITVFNDGKPNYYEVSPEIYEMWTKGNSVYVLQMMPKFARFFGRTLRAGAILNPRFMMNNFIRDTWGAALFTQYGKGLKGLKEPIKTITDMIYQPIAMLAEAIGEKELYVEWMKAGGGMSTLQGTARDAIVKNITELQKGRKHINVIRWLKSVGAVSEEMNRLKEFAKAIKFYGNTPLGRQMAAFASRDLSIDFMKMGLKIKAINQIIPFFNATIQGTDKLVRMMANPKTRPSAILRIMSVLALPSLLLWLANRGDEEIEERSRGERDRNFLFRVGDKIRKFAVPFETGVAIHGLTQRFLDWAIERKPDAFKDYLKSVTDAIMPGVIPTFMLPSMEQWANKSFFTGRQLIPTSQKDLVSRYQYKNGTSVTSRLIGRAMEYMLGPDTTSGLASPIIIDNYINDWTGGMGKIIVNTLDSSFEALGMGDQIPKPYQAITEKLGLDALISRHPRGGATSIQDFYDLYDKAMTIKKSVNYAKKMNLDESDEEKERFFNAGHIYNYDQLNAAHKAMQKSQKAINEIYKSPEIDPKEKRFMIEDLYNQMIEFAKVANESIRETKEFNR